MCHCKARLENLDLNPGLLDYCWKKSCTRGVPSILQALWVHLLSWCVLYNYSMVNIYNIYVYIDLISSELKGFLFSHPKWWDGFCQSDSFRFQFSHLKFLLQMLPCSCTCVMRHATPGHYDTAIIAVGTCTITSKFRFPATLTTSAWR